MAGDRWPHARPQDRLLPVAADRCLCRPLGPPAEHVEPFAYPITRDRSMTAFTTGILLTYYEPYVDHALARFKALLQSLPGRHDVLVVHNGPGGAALSQRVGLQVIDGDNSLREFSGWDVGLEHCRRNGLLEQSDAVVFANDTFCHHNKFGPVTQFAFRQALRRLLRAPAAPVLTGEVHALGKPYQIDGLICDRWVATYLFGISSGLLQRLGRLTPETSIADFYRPKPGHCSDDDLLEFSDLVSPNLALHVERWLMGDGITRWQGSSSIDGARTLATVQGKANSVLCEKHLTSRAIALGGTLTNVFSSPVMRQARRLETLPEKLAALMGVRDRKIYGG